jgi:hypothetical protein
VEGLGDEATASIGNGAVYEGVESRGDGVGLNNGSTYNCKNLPNHALNRNDQDEEE